MSPNAAPPPVLRTTAGDFPPGECRVAVGGKEWSILYTAAVVTRDDEARFLAQTDRPPYGVALGPAAIALAHEVATRAEEFRGRSVLELGAGTGMPGIVARSLGAEVVQTDRHELALHLCRLNGDRNRAAGIVYRLADWSTWGDSSRYDRIIGSDILYAGNLHPQLRRIFENNLSPRRAGDSGRSVPGRGAAAAGGVEGGRVAHQFHPLVDRRWDESPPCRGLRADAPGRHPSLVTVFGLTNSTASRNMIVRKLSGSSHPPRVNPGLMPNMRRTPEPLWMRSPGVPGAGSKSRAQWAVQDLNL